MLGTLQDLPTGRRTGRRRRQRQNRARRVRSTRRPSGALTFATDEALSRRGSERQAPPRCLVEASLAPKCRQNRCWSLRTCACAWRDVLRALQPAPAARPVPPSERSRRTEDAELAGDVYVGANAYVGTGARDWTAAASSVPARTSARMPSSASRRGFIRARVYGRLPHRRPRRAPCRVRRSAATASAGRSSTAVSNESRRSATSCSTTTSRSAPTPASIARRPAARTIGAGTKIDNLVQIGHNCRIGKHCAIASLSGSRRHDGTRRLRKGGRTGRISRTHAVGSRVTIAGQSGVWGDVPDDATISGNPARDHRDDLRREVMIRRLPKLVRSC